MSFKDDELIFRYFQCKNKYEKDFNKDLINRFANAYRFCNEHINKFVLLLRKGVYPYELITTIFMFKVIYYCLQMYLKASETSVLKYMSMTLLIFCLHLD